MERGTEWQLSVSAGDIISILAPERLDECWPCSEWTAPIPVDEWIEKKKMSKRSSSQTEQPQEGISVRQLQR
jgi:hypothetical protein